MRRRAYLLSAATSTAMATSLAGCLLPRSENTESVEPAISVNEFGDFPEGVQSNSVQPSVVAQNHERAVLTATSVSTRYSRTTHARGLVTTTYTRDGGTVYKVESGTQTPSVESYSTPEKSISRREARDSTHTYNYIARTPISEVAQTRVVRAVFEAAPHGVTGAYQRETERFLEISSRAENGLSDVENLVNVLGLSTLITLESTARIDSAGVVRELEFTGSGRIGEETVNFTQSLSVGQIGAAEFVRPDWVDVAIESTYEVRSRISDAAQMVFLSVTRGPTLTSSTRLRISTTDQTQTLSLEEDVAPEDVASGDLLYIYWENGVPQLAQNDPPDSQSTFDELPENIEITALSRDGVMLFRTVPRRGV